MRRWCHVSRGHLGGSQGRTARLTGSIRSPPACDRLAAPRAPLGTFRPGGACCLPSLPELVAEMVILNGMCNWSCAVMRSLVARRNVGRDTERDG